MPDFISYKNSAKTTSHLKREPLFYILPDQHIHVTNIHINMRTGHAHSSALSFPSTAAFRRILVTLYSIFYFRISFTYVYVCVLYIIYLFIYKVRNIGFLKNTSFILRFQKIFSIFSKRTLKSNSSSMLYKYFPNKKKNLTKS